MKKPASKVAEPAQIQPKSQFLFHKNLPPQDFSLMTLQVGMKNVVKCYKDFFGYFNALKTRGDILTIFRL